MMSKSNDVNAEPAIKAINEMKTVDEINAYISDEAANKNRKTVLDAASERIEEIENPPAPEENKGDDAPAKESPAATKKGSKTRTEEFEGGQSLGRIHDRENYEKGLKQTAKAKK
jgi:hypothetical protein